MSPMWADIRDIRAIMGTYVVDIDAIGHVIMPPKPPLMQQ